MMHKFSKRNRSISNTKMFSETMAWQLQCALLVLLCAAESTYSGKVSLKLSYLYSFPLGETELVVNTKFSVYLQKLNT